MPYRSWLSQPLRPQCPLLPQVGPSLTPHYPCPSGACPQPRHPSLCFRGWRGTGEKGGDVCLAGGPRRALFVYFHLHASAAAGPDSSVSERAPEPPLFPMAARPTAHGAGETAGSEGLFLWEKLLRVRPTTLRAARASQGQRLCLLFLVQLNGRGETFACHRENPRPPGLAVRTDMVFNSCNNSSRLLSTYYGPGSP